MRWQQSHLLAIVTLFFLGLRLDTALHGEILLDDFTVPGYVFAPSNAAANYSLDQLDHGPFGLTRHMDAIYGYPDLDGMASLESAGIAGQLLLGRQVNPPPWGDHFAEWTELGLSYSTFPQNNTVDLSQGNTNNAIFLDFAYFNGPGAIGGIFISIYAQTFQGRRILDNIPITDSPFTLTIPMSSLSGLRPQPYTLDQIYSIGFGFRSTGHPLVPYFENRSWEFALDRIRIGYVAPEPASIWFSMLLFAPSLRSGGERKKRGRG